MGRPRHSGRCCQGSSASARARRARARTRISSAIARSSSTRALLQLSSTGAREQVTAEGVGFVGFSAGRGRPVQPRENARGHVDLHRASNRERCGTAQMTSSVVLDPMKRVRPGRGIGSRRETRAASLRTGHPALETEPDATAEAPRRSATCAIESAIALGIRRRLLRDDAERVDHREPLVDLVPRWHRRCEVRRQVPRRGASEPTSGVGTRGRTPT